jgi:hypothetical protein
MKDVTRKLKADVKKKPYKIVSTEVKVSFIQDGNKTLTLGLVAELNDSTIGDVNEILFNECLEEAHRLLLKAGRNG